MADSPILPPPPESLATWAATALRRQPDALTLSPVTGDAGSRRYYRVRVEREEKTYIAVVDDSPEQQRAFLHTQRLFVAAGTRVPKVLKSADNFLLLEDFGDTTYRRHLRADADALYKAAIGALINFQGNTDLAAELPPYNSKRLINEMDLFAEWYCKKHHARPLSPVAEGVVYKAKHFLAGAMLDSPQVAVHRDYHSRNLMVLNVGAPPGVLDFQDAVRGDALYDVVSLLRDAYIEWNAAKQEEWLRFYWENARVFDVPVDDSWEECERRFNIAGAQRGLKVLGIFARLAYRDGKKQYLDDLPLVHRHITAACTALPELKQLAEVIADYPPS